VVGSNIFNILAILGVCGVIAPDGLAVDTAFIVFDIPVMIAVAVATLPIFFTGYRISRLEGLLFLGYYVAYTLFLVLRATQHDALAAYGLAMKTFVLPLTAITIAVLVVRSVRAGRRSAGADGSSPG
jgi:cation:H+ antiporter